MSRVVLTGATGHLGHLAAHALVRSGLPRHDLVVAGRNAQRLQVLASHGFRGVAIDYDDSPSLRQAFQGADTLLLVASSDVGRRTGHHANAIAAASDSGVQLIVYTSLAGADSNSSGLAVEHRETEHILQSSGIPFVILRNGWFMENFTSQIGRYRKHGRIVFACGEGLISAATRADLADAAARVVTSSGHEGAVYELGGTTAFTVAQFAAELSRQSGDAVLPMNLPVEEFEQFMLSVGYPPDAARLYAGVECSLAADELLVRTDDLTRLIGRPPMTMAEAVSERLG